MHKKCVSRCIIAGIFFTILMTGCTSIPASSPVKEISKEIVNMEVKNALEGFTEQIQNAKSLFREEIFEFYDIVEEVEVSDKELEEWCKKMLEDNLLQDGKFRLTACEISDLDQNGQKDMIVMVVKPGDSCIDAPGCIYIYFNDEPLYCFEDEDEDYDKREISTYDLGFCNRCQAGDIDNDGNLELMISIYNGGNGGTGGREHIILKHKDNTFEEMELSEDMGEKNVWELYVSVGMGNRENLYEAYCPYLDDTVEFYSDNAYPFESKNAGRGAGSNCRGFYDYRCVEYEGKNALQCSEYLYGEGGIAHSVGSAEFIIVWDEEGECDVAKWWVEPW